MKPLHKIILVGTTFVLAAATGHVMQNPNSFGLAGQTANVLPGLEVQNVQNVANIVPAGVQVSGLQIEGLARLPDAAPLRAPAADQATGPLPSDTASEAGFAVELNGAPPALASCTDKPELLWESVPSASLHLTLRAPCAGGEVVALHHEGLALPVALSAQGEWSGVVPALASPAVITLALPDGSTLAAEQAVPALEKVNRVVLAGSAQMPFVLHGLEYGSAFNAAGDVQPLAPRTADTPLGGWMAAFAAPGADSFVQIYSAPVELTDLRLEVEAAVSADFCGVDAQATVRRLMAGKAEAPAALSIALPDCTDATGAVLMRLPDFPLSVALN